VEFACSPFVPLGVLAPARPGGSFTATVKLSYDLSEGGWARPTLTPDPIVESAGGPYPRDLLGVKQACDVAIVGWATQEPGPVTFGAGGRVWAKAAARLGAPIDSAHGDPGFAPHDQRIPFPELPLEVTYESQAKRLRAVVPGPPPAIGLVHFSTWHAMRVLPSALDGVLLDPVRAIVILTFRALFSHDGDPDRDLTLVVFPPAQRIGGRESRRCPCGRRSSVLWRSRPASHGAPRGSRGSTRRARARASRSRSRAQRPTTCCRSRAPSP
jgi:hypothetical protein